MVLIGRLVRAASLRTYVRTIAGKRRNPLGNGGDLVYGRRTSRTATRRNVRRSNCFISARPTGTNNGRSSDVHSVKTALTIMQSLIVRADAITIILRPGTFAFSRSVRLYCANFRRLGPVRGISGPRPTKRFRFGRHAAGPQN